MSVQPQAILGIDIAKKTFQVALLYQEKCKYKTFDNSLKGFHALSHGLSKQGVTNSLHTCLEATGTYGDSLACYLLEAGFEVSVVNPAKIKGFAQCQLKRIKSDKADAMLIAQYCLIMRPTRWQPEPVYIQQLQGLDRRLDDLVIALNQEQNRLAVALEIVKSSIQTMIDRLK